MQAKKFLIAPLNSDIPAFEALVTEIEEPPKPIDPGVGKPGWHFITTLDGKTGWILGYGPFDKPRPVSDAPEVGKWQMYTDGWYFVMRGPLDKPGPGGPEEPGEGPTIRWKYTDEGWTREVGPFDDPHPEVPPEFPVDADGEWEQRDNGWYFVSGPYDKPRPPGPIPPDKPPVEPAPPEYDWVFLPEQGGWYFMIGPFDKPRPQTLAK